MDEKTPVATGSEIPAGDRTSPQDDFQSTPVHDPERDKKLELSGEAIKEKISLDHPSHEGFHNLVKFHLDRFRHSGYLNDVERAIEYGTRAINLTPKGHSELPQHLADLGRSYSHRYQWLGGLDDLEKAMEYGARATELTPDGHPELPNRLAYLGVSYTDRYQRLGRVDDLEKSFEHRFRALALTPDGDPKLPERLADLGGSYVNRYRLLGEVDDLEEALDYDCRALKLTPDGHPGLPDRLAGLAVSYSDRYRLLGEVGDLDKSLEYGSRSVKLTPNGHAHLPRRLGNLAVSYGDRYRLLGELTPDDHADLPDRLVSLALSYTDRYQLLDEAGDLEKVLEYESRALALTPDNHPDLSMRHFNLAISYIDQYKHTGDPSHLNNSLDSFRRASYSIAAPPRDRFQYAFVWAKRASEHSTSLNPVEAYRATIHLLPQFIWIGATTAQRYHDLYLAENLAVRAASAAILDSNHMLALEWLEHARCVVWNQSVMLRSPIDLLASSHSELAIRLHTAAEQLHRASSRPSGLPASASGSDPLEDRYRLTREYNDLLSQARALPGFSDFLQPMKSNGLIHAARYGPIVVINCHHDQCDALIILPKLNNVRHLALPNFTEAAARHAQTEMEISLQRKGLRERGVRFRQGAGPDFHIQGVLATIWTGIVKPVLDLLGYTDRLSPDSLPHITWCPTGAVSFLPLHAAGDYSQPGSRVFDYAVSSYTPTLTSFLAATPNALSHDSRVLAVGQEATSGHNPLPGTTKEIAYLKAHVEDVAQYAQLTGDKATRAAVLDAMEQHDWVHLACHAHQNASDPTKSGFFLHDGTLDLADINQRSFRNKGLAFLSACQTARGDEKLPDEAIHLASGMLMTGYTSVIATMWSVSDADAPLVADKVYAGLMKDGKVGNGEAGRALHYAIAELRNKIGEKEFGRWVPYIHIGA